METSFATPHYANSSNPFSASIVAGKHHSGIPRTTAIISFSLKPTPPTPPGSGKLERPRTPKSSSSAKSTPKTPSNPLKGHVNSTRIANQPAKGTKDVHFITNKLWLTSKLSPPPPPPSPAETVEETDDEVDDNQVEENSGPPRNEFRQEGKIFVGNLPNWVKKNEVSDFFRQFGPIKNVILIKAHNSTQRNAHYGFVLFGGSTADRSAMKAVEFDGVEFHGRVLTVKLDDGRRLKEKMEVRARWVEGYDEAEHPSKWHEERESSRKDFKKILETEPENWQAVVQSFERIKKVLTNQKLFLLLL